MTQHLLSVAKYGVAASAVVIALAVGMNLPKPQLAYKTTEVKVIHLPPLSSPTAAAVAAPSPSPSAAMPIQKAVWPDVHSLGLYNGNWVPILVDAYGHVRVKLDESDRQYIIQALKR